MKTPILFFLCTVVVAESGRYEGYKVYQLTLENQQQEDVVARFAPNELYDFWSAPRMLGLPTTIMVHPKVEKVFVRILNETNIPYNILIKDAEKTLKAEHNRQKRAEGLKKWEISFTTYNRYSDIENYIQQLALDHTDIVSLEHFQTTYERRKMWLIKIGSSGVNKPVILIDGGIHAREWISPAVVLYIIHQLVENSKNRHLIESVDWYIIPSLNPDGYEYTHTHDRMWRTNRAPVKNATCKGTDLNRNFDFHWAEVGVKHRPACNVLFPGRAPFDQLESRGLRDVVIKYKDRIKLYLTFHSYAKLILYPWGYTKEKPRDAPKLQALGEQAANAIAKVAGTVYGVGNVPQLLSLGAGGSDDWVKGVGGVDLSYTIELPGGGRDGFDLPAEHILPVCTETFEGVKVFHDYIRKEYGRTN